MELEPNLDSLNKLLEMGGDIYCFEPTGSYSWVWNESLLQNGKEVRLIGHNKTESWRGVCGWKAKDDEHDAVVIAYYCWSNINSLSAFNRVRSPKPQEIYRLYLTKERYVKELRVLLNRTRNLLHHEFPERRNVKHSETERPSALWPFIAGEEISKGWTTRYSRELAGSIGSASRDGFSPELIDKATKINGLQKKRAEIKSQIGEILRSPEFIPYRKVFAKFGFGILEQGIILSQIYPFEQFLNGEGKELRLKKRNGNSRRVAFNKFHSLLGKAPAKFCSGDKEGVIVAGPTLCRNALMVWANREICRSGNPEKTKPWLSGRVAQILYDQYLIDCQMVGSSLTILQATEATDLEQCLNTLKLLAAKDNRPAAILSPLLEKAINEKKQGKKNGQKKELNKKGQQILALWAKSRISDRAVKLLFQELLQEFRR